MQNNKILDKEIEQWFRRDISPKIKQKMELLELNKGFLKNISNLKKKHKKLVREYNLYLKKIWFKLDKIWANTGIWNKIKTGNFKLADCANLITPKDKKIFNSLEIKAYKPFEDKEFNKDAIGLCKKYKLYPANLWRHSLILYIATGHFTPLSYWLKTGLDKFMTKEEKKNILKLPPKLNFAVKIETNKETKEPELFVQIFENTSLRDLDKNWQIVFEQQKKLKELKNIKKRFYPFKNLSIMEKLIKIDKKKKEIYYEPVSGKSIKIKMTDINKALKIYPNIPFNRKEELKAGNRLKQIRHQYKKKII
ncbi:MAG: hypothetical protein PHF44_04410 [Candidatus Pacebacteria bacterium]|nr:hypothetical protein [Candidatus Paceibacterota bacterium]